MAELLLDNETADELKIGSYAFKSRLMVGTSRYPSPQVMLDSIEASGAEFVTVSIRRVNVYDKSDESVLALLSESGLTLLPYTAGWFTAEEVVLVAYIAIASMTTDLIMLVRFCVYQWLLN